MEVVGRVNAKRDARGSRNEAYFFIVVVDGTPPAFPRRTIFRLSKFLTMAWKRATVKIYARKMTPPTTKAKATTATTTMTTTMKDAARYVNGE